ncbi:MAG TPA: hypothetical protein VIQ24_07395 [Pyrinomonadaceae bacterium]
MSDKENIRQDEETEEELTASNAAAPVDSPDDTADEGDRPIIIQGGGSGNPG